MSRRPAELVVPGPDEALLSPVRPAFTTPST
jgi:hypothetical protein